MRTRELLLAALSIVPLLVRPATAEDDPFVTDLQHCRDLTRRRSFTSARDGYDKLFETYANDPRVFANLPEIEHDVLLCEFQKGRKAPSGTDLFGPSVKSLSMSSRRIEMVFEDGTGAQGWTTLAGDLRMLDVRFDDEVQITAPANGGKGSTSKGADPRAESGVHLRALVFLEPDFSGGYFVLPSFGGSLLSDYERGDIEAPNVIIPAKHRIFHLKDGKFELLEVSGGGDRPGAGSWSQVTRKGDVLSIDTGRCGGTKLKHKSHTSGFVAVESTFGTIGGARTSLKVTGKVDKQFLQERISALDEQQFAAWKTTCDRSAVFPKWVIDGPAKREERVPPLPPDVSARLREPSMLFLRSVERWDVMEARVFARQLEKVGGAVGLFAGGLLKRLDGAYGAAEAEFTRTIDMSPRFGAVYVERAFCRLARGAEEEAQSDLDRAAELDAGNPRLYFALTALCLRSGDLERAQGVISSAAGKGAWSETLEALAHHVGAAANGPKRQREYKYASTHFDVRSDVSLQSSTEIARELEDALRTYVRQFRPFPDRKHAARVYIFSSREAYNAYADELGWDASHTAGAYVPTLRVLIAWIPEDRPEFVRTLRHEGFHQYVHNFVDGLPHWFNEGYAEYFGNSVVEGSRLKDDGRDAEYARIWEAVGTPEFTPLDKLLRTSGSEFMANADTHYPESWLLIRALESTSDKDLRKLLPAFFDAMLAGKSADEARAEVLDPHLSEIQREFERQVEDVRTTR